MSHASSPPVSWRSSALISLAFLAASRLVFWTAALFLQATGAMRVNPGYERFPDWLTGAYARFDHGHFLRIAMGGYFQLDRGKVAFDEAFFPGYPFAARGLAWLFTGGAATEQAVTAAMSVISWGGAFVAGTLLVHLARERRLFGADGRLMATVFYFGPYALFYMAAYSEGPFVACAIGTWELARRKRWGWAAVVASLATVLRINGLFLLPMLALMMLWGQWRRPVAWARLSWLVLPMLPPALYFTYLWSVTGNWLTWFKTQEHWGRKTTAPWESLRFSIELISADQGFAITFQRILEITAVVLFIAVLVQLGHWRCWELFVFTLITLASLTTSTWFQSIPRAMLSCFPVLVVLAVWLTKSPRWLRWCGLAVCWAILAVNVYTILGNQWTG